jgi:hypothetical protein
VKPAPVVGAIAGTAGAESRGYVVLESGGGLWGILGSEVRGLRRRRHGGMELAVAGGELAADSVLAVVPGMEVWPTPAALGRYWPEAALGLAVYAERPVLVIDPERPPGNLLAAAPDVEDAELKDDEA